MSALTVSVPGLPIGQGNIRHLGKGRPAVHQNAEKLLPWRQAIAWHTRQAMTDQGIGEPLTGPLCLTAVFTMPRGVSIPRSRWAPDKRPDLSHLVRALEDAIVQGGGIVDDSQIVEYGRVRKVYQQPDRLPGVEFTIRPAIDGAP
jgi:Holliday junction resolvase RusA-like endonuclease